MALHIVRGRRAPVSIGLLTVAAAALVWYVASGFTDMPGMIAAGSLFGLLALYGSWRERDRHG